MAKKTRHRPDSNPGRSARNQALFPLRYKCKALELIFILFTPKLEGILRYFRKYSFPGFFWDFLGFSWVYLGFLEKPNSFRNQAIQFQKRASTATGNINSPMRR